MYLRINTSNCRGPSVYIYKYTTETIGTVIINSFCPKFIKVSCLIAGVKLVTKRKTYNFDTFN